MKSLFAAFACLALALPCLAAESAAPADWHTESVPLYVWGIVAVLGMVWLTVLLPPRLSPWRGAIAARMPEPLPVGAAVLPAAPAAAPPAGPGAWSLDALRKLSPRRFEELVQALWQTNGYKAVLTGTDVKIHHAPTGRLFAVAQCQPPAGAPVGADPVRELWETVQRHVAGMGICYSVAGFAAGTLAFAQGKRLKLVSGAELLAQVRALRPEQQKALLDHVWRR